MFAHTRWFPRPRMDYINICPSKVSLITTLAAGIFVAQMLNWPLPGGTSLHFVGGALAGILLGPIIWFSNTRTRSNHSMPGIS